MGFDGTRILMFHRVQPEKRVAFGLPDSYRIRGTSLTPDEFEAALDAAGAVVPLQALEHAIANGLAPPRASVLTFDDGYREHLDWVVPRLESRGMSGTFYVSTGLHGSGTTVAAVDAWYWVLDHARRAEAEVPLPEGGTFRGRLDTLEGKSAWISGPPKEALLRASHASQSALVEALAEAAGCSLRSDLAVQLYLHPEEWLALEKRGMRLGAHGVRHLRMTELSEAELSREVVDSISALGPTGGPVPFAYPDGAYDNRAMAIARRAGASSAVTCESGDVVRGADLMRLARRFVAPALLATIPR